MKQVFDTCLFTYIPVRIYFRNRNTVFSSFQQELFLLKETETAHCKPDFHNRQSQYK